MTGRVSAGLFQYAIRGVVTGELWANRGRNKSHYTSMQRHVDIGSEKRQQFER